MTPPEVPPTNVDLGPGEFRLSAKFHFEMIEGVPCLKSRGVTWTALPEPLTPEVIPQVIAHMDAEMKGWLGRQKSTLTIHEKFPGLNGRVL